MRIRKNSKVSPLLFLSHEAAPEDLQPHVCKLNQSPWDVIPFRADSNNQFDGEDSFYGNSSLGDSIGAVESVASMMDICEDKAAEMVQQPVFHDNGKGSNNSKREEEERRWRSICCQHSDGTGWHCKKEVGQGQSLCDYHLHLRRMLPTGMNPVMKSPGEKGSSNSRELEDEDEEDQEEERRSRSKRCQKSDGRGWQCKKEAKQGHSFCNHHLSLLRSRDNSNNTNNIASKNSFSSKKARGAAVASAVLAVGARRSRAKAAKRGSTSNPYEFYYYSGFGPLWGRKRGEKEKEESNKISSATTSTTSLTHQATPQSSSSKIDDVELDYVDDFDEDDDDGGSGDSGRKRMRKPVKARSLKSLM